MSLTVKAYLERVNAEPEIRRFSVDHAVASNYAYLYEKVCQVFPSIKKFKYELRWKGEIAFPFHLIK